MVKDLYQSYLAINFPSYKRAVRAAAQESRWVCWVYDVQEWQLLARDLEESRRLRLRGVLIRGILFTLLLGVCSSAAMLNHASPGLLELALVITGVSCAAAFVRIIVGQLYNSNQAAQQALQQGSRQICIGPLAVFLPGQSLALGGYSVQGATIGGSGIDVLEGVAVQDGTPVKLVFTGRKLGGIGMRGSLTLGAPMFIDVPIPAGHETEAAELVKRFQTMILEDISDSSSRNSGRRLT